MIRPLNMTADLDSVTQFYIDAPDYWQTVDGCAPGVEKAKEFFEDIPPKCNPDYAHTLGFFLDQRLSGIADLFLDFQSLMTPISA